MRKRIVFLTNDEKNTRGIRDWLVSSAGEDVVDIREKISPQVIEHYNPDFLISYNYRHIIRKDVLPLLSNRAINLHISLLPWNRGAHPNLWSFLDDTPKGVTIHCIDAGIDTGDILVQKEVFLDEKKETLKSAYNTLHAEIQALFRDNWLRIRNAEIIPCPQTGEGSMHYLRDFSRVEFLLEGKGWDTPISDIVRHRRAVK